ncbi:hypothetical protein DACRYDRAFT_85981 [Dacryopinax primogenitus]|uniref:Nuclear segregation protein Bfr1 n=1 Tax=Dacryopinax primogenitus (strain DJM 731) TaxID=1858805 RepID=M5GFD6_DACPD|nr:uncharacterized protein DACRYDRAFT_85981 [Dacryopinax primogenitus]EJU06177.1 hypothetical protein DACRYDRAFT_85981 [Dacryopinax primogenitus]
MASAATTKAPKQKSGSKKEGKSKGTSSSAPATPIAEKPDAPVGAADGETDHHGVQLLAGGRPDQAAYNAEQEKYKAEITKLQDQLNIARQKLTGGGKDGPQAERRQALRKEQDGLREQQAKIKDSRGKILAQIKASQENITKKIESLKLHKSKTPFKTTTEIDNRISQLEKQVDAGTMKVVDEKRALAEISNLRRLRKNFEGFQGEEDSIGAERAKIDELRKKLDDPEAKSISDRYEAIRNELLDIQKEGDELYASRSKLIEERNSLQDKVNALWSQRKESIGAFQEAKTKYITKQQEERHRREERYRQQRAAEEADRIKEITERLREEAQMPAHQAQIEDCQTLIDYFTIRLSGGSAPAPVTSADAAPSDIAGVKALEIRQVASEPSDGMVVRKKKGDAEDAYFVGGGKKGKKGAKAANGHANGVTHEPKATDKLNLPFGTLTALLELSIPPPTSHEDIPQAIENLQKKKAYFVAIQPKATQDQIAKVEAEIKKLQKKLDSMTVNGDAQHEVAEALPPNGTGEQPAEPTATPAVPDHLSVSVPSEAVDKELEIVKEEEDAEEAS